MNPEIQVKAQDLTETAAAPFGQVVAVQTGQTPDNAGLGWQCWYPLGELTGPAPLRIGLVRTESFLPTIAAMERHTDRPEWVFALDRPILQVVALSSAAGPAWPDPSQVAAFVLQPGQGLLIRAGVWHAPGMSTDECPALYGFVLGKPSDAGHDSGWVAFKDGAIVRLSV